MTPNRRSDDEDRWPGRRWRALLELRRRPLPNHGIMWPLAVLVFVEMLALVFLAGVRW